MYLVTDVFPIFCLRISISSTSLGSSFSRSSSTVAFCKLGISIPLSFIQAKSCAFEFGFLSPVISIALFINSSVLNLSISIAPSKRLSSIFTPLWLIPISCCHSVSTVCGTGQKFNLCKMLYSASTSCLLYSLKSSHFSGACLGKFLFLPPLLFVGLQGLQKYLIRAFPVVNFCLSSGRPTALPIASSEAGSPQYIPCIMVHFH